jgi:hypothetical protein
MLLAHGAAKLSPLGLDLLALQRQVEAVGLKSSAPLFVTATALAHSRSPELRVSGQAAGTGPAPAQRGALACAGCLSRWQGIRFDKLSIFTLRHNASRKNYDSGLWHHDDCGKQLKLFLYTQAVGRAYSTQRK